MKNVVIAIDLAFRSTGIIIARPDESHETGFDLVSWDSCHTGHVAKNKQHAYVADVDLLKCKHIWTKLNGVYQECINNDMQPKGLVVETPTAGAKGARANRCMGMATGIIACIADYWRENYSCMSKWIQPRESKKHLLGRANASKDDMEAAVRALWPDFEWPELQKDLEHVGDAAALLPVVQATDFYLYVQI